MPAKPQVFNLWWTSGPVGKPVGPGKQLIRDVTAGDSLRLLYLQYDGQDAVDASTLTLGLVMSKTIDSAPELTIAAARFHTFTDATTGKYGFYVDILEGETGALEAGSHIIRPLDLTSGTGHALALDEIWLLASAEYTPGVGPALGYRAANTVLAGPASGADASPSFRAIVVADLPDLSSLYDAAGAAAAVSVVSAANNVQVFTGLTYYVATDGNDSNNGLTPDAPFLTLAHAASVATVAGTLVSIGAGTFALGSVSLRWSDGVSVVGAGIDVTTITSTRDSGTSEVQYRPGSHSLHQDFTIASDLNIGTSMPFGCWDSTGFVNVVARRLKITGQSDGIYLRTLDSGGTVPVELTTIDCVVECVLDAVNIFNSVASGGSKALRSWHYNLTLTVVAASAGTAVCRGFPAASGTHYLFGGSISVSGNSTTTCAGITTYARPNVSINVFGTKVRTSSTGSATPYDLSVLFGAINVFGAADYVTTNGTVSVFDGAISASNLSGTNSGDQDLTTLAPLVGSTINAQTSTSYALVLSDAGKTVTLSNAAAITLSVPAASTVAWLANSRIDLAQIGAGQVTISPASGVTVSSKGGNLKITGQYSGATLLRTATNAWLLVGDLSS